MDIDSIFKTPAVPVKGGAKRKLPPSPDEIFRTTGRHQSYDELTGRKFEVEGSAGSTSQSANKKQKGVSIEDEEDEESRSVMGGSAVGGGSNDQDFSYPGEDDEDDRFFGDGLTSDQKDILDYVDEIDPDEERFDLGTVRKMILKFERSINKNQEMRVKYADDPAKFMESEADLDEEIKHLMTLTQAPQHYPVLVELNTVSSILSLLPHENVDISISAIELIKELTDEDVVGDEDDADQEQSGESGVKIFVNAMIDQGLLDLLVQNLARLDEQETNDKQGVFDTLNIFENLTAIDGTLAEKMGADKVGLIQWLLKRMLTVKGFDSNKQYCSELLAILLQSSAENRRRLGVLGGIDTLLQLLAGYKRKDPKDPDEIEMVENLFDGLCSSLSEPEIKQRFLEGEGNELMVIMVKEKKMARIRAIKVLDYALSTKAGTANCLRFVEILGLRTLFSIFGRKGGAIEKLKKSYKNFSEVEEEEHVIGILASLLRNLPEDSGHRLRVVQKFCEDKFIKLERLLDIREGYDARVKAVDERFEKERQLELAEEMDEDLIEELEQARSLQRLDEGLYVLQLVDLILAHLCAEDLDLSLVHNSTGDDEDQNMDGGDDHTNGEPSSTSTIAAGKNSSHHDTAIKKQVVTLMNRRGESIQEIKDVLEEYLAGLQVDQDLARAAREKLLKALQQEAAKSDDGEVKDKEEEEEDKVTTEEELALEALEAKESVEYLLTRL